MNNFLNLIKNINFFLKEKFEKKYKIIVEESPYLNKKGVKKGVYYDFCFKNYDAGLRTGNPPKICRINFIDAGNLYICINKQGNKIGNFNEIKFNVYNQIFDYIIKNKNGFLFNENHKNPQNLEEYTPLNVVGESKKHFFRSVFNKKIFKKEEIN